MNAPPTSSPHETRNFLALFFDMVFYGVALSIIDPTTIIPAFVGKLTTHNGLIGLASSLFYVVWLFPQLLAARFISRAPARKVWVVWPGLFARLLFLALSAGILWVGPNSPQLLLWGFILACTLARGIEGIVATAWSDLLGSSLQTRSRSRVLGYAQVLQGPLIIFSALTIVPYTLSYFPYPKNFALLFAVAGLLMLFGWGALIQVKERPPKQALELPPLKEYPRFLLNTIQKDPIFGRFLIVRLGFDIANGASVFYTVYALQVLKQPSAQILGHFVLLLIAGRVITALSLTPAIERFGHRVGIWLGLFVLSAHLLCAIFATFSPMPYAIYLLYFCTFLRGCERCTWSLGFFNWVLHHAPDEQRPVYIGLANLSTALGLLSPILAGALLTFLPYTALFFLFLFVALFAFFLARKLP